MLLAVDIGNSATKFGVFHGSTLVSKISIPSSRTAGAAYVADEIRGRLTHTFTAAIVASVVPEMDQPVREYLQLEHNIDPIFVDHDFDFALTIKYEPLTSLGIDRLVNAAAAASLYQTPCVVCSFGTATTIDVVSADREYLGGVIAPGMGMMASALHLATSKLPLVKIERPESILGLSTDASIRSGIFYGYAGMVEGLIARIIRSSPFEGTAANLVATGGNAETIAAEVAAIDTVNPNLTLEGLRILFEKHVI
jgi:type III pantothenate kinase